MCFIKSKSPSPKVPDKVEEKQVVSHQANASLTKTSVDQKQTGYQDNIRTSVIGLTDEANTKKKTLLGE